MMGPPWVRHIAQRIVLCGALFSLFEVANATILVEESFSHGNGDLVGNAAMPGPGPIWVAHLDAGNSPIQVVEEVAVLQHGKGSGGREDASIEFARQPANGTTFARFDFRLPAISNSDIVNIDPEGSNFAHLKSNNLTNHFRARTGAVAPTAGGDFGLAINANGSRLNEGTPWPTDLSFDTWYRVIVSWNAGTGESQLWLNPVDVLSNNISHLGHSVGQRIESFALRQSSDYTGNQLVDNLVVATTFAEALLGTNSRSILTGDYNNDGTVDAADYTVWRDNLGSPGSLSNDDTPTVGQDDYDRWKSHFGQVSGSGSGATANTAVPEPGSLMLLISAAAGWRLRRRCAA